MYYVAIVNLFNFEIRIQYGLPLAKVDGSCVSRTLFFLTMTLERLFSNL